MNAIASLDKLVTTTNVDSGDPHERDRGSNATFSVRSRRHSNHQEGILKKTGLPTTQKEQL